MEIESIRNLLEEVKSGRTGINKAISTLRDLPFEDLGFAKVDHHRSLRNGFPEVVFGMGKTPGQIASIVESLIRTDSNIMVTRADRHAFDEIKKITHDAVYHETARIIVIKKRDLKPSDTGIAVVTAGTSDIPVAEEAAVTAETMGNKADRIYDVGVAGIHRLFANIGKLSDAGVIVVVAGMEGALASVVGGLVDRPVIGVPTSVGYGASFGGLSALLTMINSCASGVSVVNIDNGFGAGYLASMINRPVRSRD